VTHPNDEAYEDGFNDGKDGSPLDDYVQNNFGVLGNSDANDAYSKGYDEGKEHRYDDDSSSSDSTCFITTACVRSMNRSDDCEELTVLRNYRDTFLASQNHLRYAIREYYQLAPQIVQVVSRLPDSTSAFEDIYARIVQPTVEMIKRGQNHSAFDHYKAEVERLVRLYLTDSAQRAT